MGERGMTKENLLSTLPYALAQDKNIHALAAAVAQELTIRAGESREAMLYQRIDELPNDVLDILAVDFAVDWWDERWPIERKRRSIKDSWRIHRMLGTPEAVNLAVQAAFGAGRVEEWFQYNGRPHHFRVTGLSLEMAQTGYSSFLRLMELTKRKSSTLDAVVMETRHTQRLYTGCGVARCDKIGIGCNTTPEDVTYLVDENGIILADENNRLIFDDDEEE